MARMSTKSFVICYWYTCLLVKLSNLANNVDIVSLHLPSGGQLVTQALVDDSFMFLHASKQNLERSIQVWDQFALASRLHINWRKSHLISCTESDLECLGWRGSVITRDQFIGICGIHWVLSCKCSTDWLDWCIGNLNCGPFMYNSKWCNVSW